MGGKQGRGNNQKQGEMENPYQTKISAACVRTVFLDVWSLSPIWKDCTNHDINIRYVNKLASVFEASIKHVAEAQ